MTENSAVVGLRRPEAYSTFPCADGRSPYNVACAPQGCVSDGRDGEAAEGDSWMRWSCATARYALQRCWGRPMESRGVLLGRCEANGCGAILGGRAPYHAADSSGFCTPAQTVAGSMVGSVHTSGFCTPIGGGTPVGEGETFAGDPEEARLREIVKKIKDWQSLEAPDRASESPMKREAALEAASCPEQQKSSWWSDAKLSEVPDLQTAASLTRTLDVRIVCHPQSQEEPAPWSSGVSSSLYEEMGMCDKDRLYTAFWLNLTGVSMLHVAEVLDRPRLELCLEDDCLARRLRLILWPVRVKLPFPARTPAQADTVGNFFGDEGATCTRSWTSGLGVKHVCIQVALSSKWLICRTIETLGFWRDNVVEILLVDWPGQQVVASYRVTVTEDLLSALS